MLVFLIMIERFAAGVVMNIASIQTPGVRIGCSRALREKGDAKNSGMH